MFANKTFETSINLESFEQKVNYLKNINDLITTGHQEVVDITNQRESNTATIRNLINVLANSIIKNILLEDRTIDSFAIFGNKEPSLKLLVEYLLQFPNSIPINAYGLINKLVDIFRNWNLYTTQEFSTQLAGVAKSSYDESYYYFKKQIRTKLGEGIRLDDEDSKFKAYLETLFDGDNNLIAELVSFINKYDLRQRISTHTLAYEGSNSISFLRSSYDIYKDIAYLTREPIEDRNLRLMQLLNGFENTATIEISPPFYSNEDEFIVRYSIVENGIWNVTSIFLPINLRRQSIKGTMDYTNVRKFAEGIVQNLASIQNLKKTRILQTSKNTQRDDPVESEMLNLTSRVTCLQFNEGSNIQESLTDLINRVLKDVYGFDDALKLFELNDQYVSSEIDGKLMPKVEEYSAKIMSSILCDPLNAKKVQALGDQYGTVVHTSKVTLSPETDLNSQGYTDGDKNKIHSGALLAAAVDSGRDGVNSVVESLSTGSLRSSFSSSCGETTERFGTPQQASLSADTSKWTSVSQVQNIPGIGSFTKVTKIDPRNVENKIAMYCCKICGAESIDPCNVLAGCANPKCKATYDKNVEVAKKETLELENEKKEVQNSALEKKGKTKAQAKADSSGTATSLVKGFLGILTFGMSDKVDAIEG